MILSSPRNMLNPEEGCSVFIKLKTQPPSDASCWPGGGQGHLWGCRAERSRARVEAVALLGPFRSVLLLPSSRKFLSSLGCHYPGDKGDSASAPAFKTLAVVNQSVRPAASPSPCDSVPLRTLGAEELRNGPLPPHAARSAEATGTARFPRRARAETVSQPGLRGEFLLLPSPARNTRSSAEKNPGFGSTPARAGAVCGAVRRGVLSPLFR